MKPAKKFEKKKVDPMNPTGLTEADYLAAEERANPKPKVEEPVMEEAAPAKPGYAAGEPGSLRTSERFKTRLAEAIAVDEKPDAEVEKQIARQTAALKRNEQAAKEGDMRAAETARKIKAKLEELRKMMP